MGLDDFTLNSYKKWFMSVNDKYDAYINDAIESMGDPFKYNGLTNNATRKSSINNLTDFLDDIQEYKEKSIKRINSIFEKIQEADGNIIDEIRPIYQQALDKINANVENVSIYEQQLIGLKNAEKYKEGTKAFNRGFNNVRGEDLIRQEIEIEDIWDRDKNAQEKLYNDINKRYTQTYHPEIGNRSYYSEQNSSFFNDDALKRYEDLKQMAPGIIITEESYNWETDIDRAHELALRENNHFDFVRQSEERARRRVNNNTTRNQVNNNSTTAQSQVNTAQSQVNTAQKKRRKSYADRRTKPINSEFNTTYYGQYNSQTRGYEYVDYKSHYSGGVSRSNYDMEWIEEKTFGEAHSNSEYGIEAPWSTNRKRNTNASDAPSTSDVPDASSAPEVNANTTNTSTSSAPQSIVNNASQPETTAPERRAQEQQARDRQAREQQSRSSGTESNSQQKKRRKKRSKTFQTEDGAEVKQYFDKNGNIRAQVRTWDDGRREVRRQHTAQTIAKDPLAKNMSAVVSTYDGKETIIHRRPNAHYLSKETTNHRTGEVVKEYSKRRHAWGGGVSEQQIINTTIEAERQKHIDNINKKYNLKCQY